MQVRRTFRCRQGREVLGLIGQSSVLGCRLASIAAAELLCGAAVAGRLRDGLLAMSPESAIMGSGDRHGASFVFRPVRTFRTALILCLFIRQRSLASLRRLHVTSCFLSEVFRSSERVGVSGGGACSVPQVSAKFFSAQSARCRRSAVRLGRG